MGKKRIGAGGARIDTEGLANFKKNYLSNSKKGLNSSLSLLRKLNIPDDFEYRSSLIGCSKNTYTMITRVEGYSQELANIIGKWNGAARKNSRAVSVVPRSVKKARIKANVDKNSSKAVKDNMNSSSSKGISSGSYSKSSKGTSIKSSVSAEKWHTESEVKSKKKVIKLEEKATKSTLRERIKAQAFKETVINEMKELDGDLKTIAQTIGPIGVLLSEWISNSIIESRIEKMGSTAKSIEGVYNNSISEIYNFMEDTINSIIKEGTESKTLSEKEIKELKSLANQIKANKNKWESELGSTNDYKISSENHVESSFRSFCENENVGKWLEANESKIFVTESGTTATIENVASVTADGGTPDVIPGNTSATTENVTSTTSEGVISEVVENKPSATTENVTSSTAEDVASSTIKSETSAVTESGKKVTSKESINQIGEIKNK